MGFRVLVSLHPAIQATGRLTLAPAGLPPAEHTSLHWTHNRTCGPRIRLFGSICQNSSTSWAETCGGERSLHIALSEAIRPSPALGPLVFLLLAFCSRKLRRSDASERSSFPPPKGLSANTRLNCRGPLFLNPSPPLLRWLSPASSLL